MFKKGEMGLGTLIIFIALTMVAAIAAGILMQTSTSIQNKVSIAKDETQGSISTGMQIIDITMQKDSNGEYSIIKESIQLSPGANSLNLDKIITMFGMNDFSATISYNGKGNTSYSTSGIREVGELGIYNEVETTTIATSWVPLADVDLGLDGLTDYVKLCPPLGADMCPDGTKNTGDYIAFNVSSQEELIYIQMVNASGDPKGDICNTGADGGTVVLNKTAIGNYGNVTLIGDVCESCCQIRAIADNLDFQYYGKRFKLTNNLDGDLNSEDYLWINSSHITLDFSNGDVYSVSLGEDLSSGSVSFSKILKIGEPDYFAKIILNGTTSRANYIDDDLEFRVLPKSITGTYDVDYIQKGKSYQEGRFSPGDTILLTMQSPTAIEEDDHFYLKVINEKGNGISREIFTNNILTEDVISLYP